MTHEPDVVLGIDFSTKRIARAFIHLGHGTVTTRVTQLPADPVQRLHAAYELAHSEVGPRHVVVPEWPMGPSRTVSMRLERVAGAYEAGCTAAGWVHEQGVPSSVWKKAVLGHGGVKAKDLPALLGAWAQERYGIRSEDPDLLVALAVATYGVQWWSSKRG